jgi:hypothetical protein
MTIWTHSLDSGTMLIALILIGQNSKFLPELPQPRRVLAKVEFSAEHVLNIYTHVFVGRLQSIGIYRTLNCDRSDVLVVVAFFYDCVTRPSVSDRICRVAGWWQTARGPVTAPTLHWN